jgi:hypothetical protein
LAGISDPTIRALVGVILAENKKLKSENALLKHQTTLTIDIQGWTVDAQGRVKNKGMQLYKAGYVTAIKKILLYI